MFAFNIAPTEEVVLIATRAGPVRGVLLALLTVALMHAMVYVVGFGGQHRSEAPGWSVLLGYSPVVEEASATIDYVPAGTQRTVHLQFTTDPQRGTVEVTGLGFSEE